MLLWFDEHCFVFLLLIIVFFFFALSTLPHVQLAVAQLFVSNTLVLIMYSSGAEYKKKTRSHAPRQSNNNILSVMCLCVVWFVCLFVCVSR